MAAHEPDPFLRRVIRTTSLLCGLTGLAALAIGRGSPNLALGVLAGTGLMAFSFKTIRDGVDARARQALAGRPAPPGADGGNEDAPREDGGLLSRAWALTKFVTRYGVLALAGWTVLVPLHANPIGVFVGVSLPVAAIAFEAARRRG